MFRFNRALILPVFLNRRITIWSLAKAAGVNYRAADRAVNGLPVQAPVVAGIADALNINPLDYLLPPAKKKD